MKKTHSLISVFVSVALIFAVAGCQIDSDRHEHSFSKDWTSNATDHWHAATCEHTKEVSGKATHTFGEWTVTKAATEEAEGSKERSCSVCGYKATEVIEKLAHTHKFATAWTKDETNHWHAATCEHTTEVSGKAEHSFGDWTVTKAATEEAEGSKERSCSVCGYTATEVIEKLAHTHKFSSDWTKDETYHWYAATCGHDVTDSKAAHSFGDYVSNNDATTEADGTKTRECSVCGYKDTVTDEGSKIHVHIFAEEWTSDETYHWHSATCGHDVTDSKAAHSFGDWTVTKAATCTEKGSRKRTCSVCKYEATEDISAKGHAYSEDWTSDATDHWHNCSGCEELRDKAAHTFGEWKTTVKATKENEGKKERSCSVCSYKEEQSIARVPEDFVKVIGGTVTGKSNTNNYPGVFIEGRTVTLSDFYMSKYEVTKAQYKAIMEDTSLNTLEITADPSYSTLKPKTYVMATGEEDYERPVENVTWYDAVYFCNLLSKKEGLEPVYTISNPQTSTESISDVGASGNETVSIKYISSATVTADHTKNGYRLPTESEWEYAARGGDPTKDDWNYVFSGKKAVNHASLKNSSLDRVGWYLYNCINGTTGDTWPSSGKQGYGTHQVGKKAPNRLGLYDMSGNVFEWCYDWYGTITTTTPADGATSGSRRVNRGGSWNCSANGATVSSRDYDYPDVRDFSCGFRVVRSSSN